MKKLLSVLFISLALVSCSDIEKDVMECGEFKVETSVSPNFLTAVINGDSVILNQEVSASGSRYAGILNETNVVLWNKGSVWTLILDETLIDCK